MEAVEGRVTNFIDDVVAGGDAPHGKHSKQHLAAEIPGERQMMQGERDNDSGKDKNILDPVIDAGDTNVSAQGSPARERQRQAGT